MFLYSGFLGILVLLGLYRVYIEFLMVYFIMFHRFVAAKVRGSWGFLKPAKLGVQKSVCCRQFLFGFVLECL